MKNIVRALVVVIALTGAAATIQSTSAKTAVTVSKTSAAPTPMCPPNSPKACGFGTGW